MGDEAPRRKGRGSLRGSAKGDPARIYQSNRTDEHLTMQQEAYCRARAMGMSLQEAALAIGTPIAPSTARVWEKNNTRIIARIQELSGIATNNAIIRTGLNREWIISRLMTVVDRCMESEPVTDNEGNETGTYKFDASGANQALRMLGDTMGLFKPAEKKDDDYANLSDADLARIAHELAAQTGLLENLARDEAPAGSEQVIEVQAVSETS